MRRAAAVELKPVKYAMARPIAPNRGTSRKAVQPMIENNIRSKKKRRHGEVVVTACPTEVFRDSAIAEKLSAAKIGAPDR
jgi:hypothetical protein